MDAYHVFYHSKSNDDRYESINYLVQIASILFWKKNHGKIGLYCNSNFINFLKKWKIDELYDTINTDVLDNIPFKDYLDKYWSFCKIEAAKDINKTKNEFVILDTDFWIHDEINIDNSYQFIGYHPESMMSHPRSPYLSPSTFLKNKDIELFDWSMEPINCAFIYLNSKHLIDEWYRWSYYIISQNKEIQKREMSADTIFIEQRLLPTLTHSLNMKVGTLIPNVYLPHVETNNEGYEWEPRIGFNEFNQYMCWNIKHIWGMKKYYQKEDIRNMVIETVISSLNMYFEDWSINFSEILDDIKSHSTLSLAY
jgi:hypothetical protein